MATPFINASVTSGVQTDYARKDVATTKTEETERKSSLSEIQAKLKAQSNTQIIESSLNLSIRSGNNSLALLYSSVVSNINESVSSEIGNIPAQNNVFGQQDTSPEATADRILSFALGFFDAYARQHPGEDTDKLATDFVSVVRGGFEKGFNEAKDILKAMNVLEGNNNVEKSIMQTYELVSKGFDDFLAAQLKAK